MTYIKDIGWILLIGLLLPLWMAIALAGLAFIVARHLYWWARGNTTSVRQGGHAQRSWAERFSSSGDWRRFWRRHMGAVRPAPIVVVPQTEAAPVRNR